MNRVFLVVFVLLAATSATAAWAVSTVGDGAAAGNPLGGVEGFYRTALAIGGLLAFGAIVYAAIEYALARGNPGMQSDARDGITQAVLGLLLLLGAFLVLRTINPQLLTPSLPAAEPTGGPIKIISSPTTPSNCGTIRCPPGETCWFNRRTGAANCVKPLPTACDNVRCPLGEECGLTSRGTAICFKKR